jgi:hypothetical protein
MTSRLVGSVRQSCAPALAVIDLGDRRGRDREACLADQLVDPGGPPRVECVIDGSQKQLLGGEFIVALIADQLLEPGGHMGDPKRPEFLVVDTGEHRAHRSCR